MSAELPLDLDVSDLEAAREEASEAILDLLELVPSCEVVRGELTELVHKISSIRCSLIRAIQACAGDPAPPARGNGAANDEGALS